MICWRCGGKYYSTANVRYGTTACTVQCHCAKCGKDDHSTEHHDIYSDVQDRRAARGAKAMSITSTQSDAPGHSFCLMARVATATSESLVASESLTLLLEEDDVPQIVSEWPIVSGMASENMNSVPCSSSTSITI